ncbi:MAG: sigma-54 dependent transcriptional regulator [Acidobacteria bacterium]|jgi:two-component system nitrogen regulation response regulator NtrX|nr:sigma-54 dependent transcriptional regulator [Acidobacteriota bacterium]
MDKTVLLVDDEKKVLILLGDALEVQGFKVKTTTLPTEALKILQNESIDAVVLDLAMPGIDGIETLQAIKKIKPRVPVIMLSGQGTIEKAVKSLKLGAHDFLEKPVGSDKIAITLKNAITQATLEQEKTGLLETAREEFRMIGNSHAMKEIHRLIERIAPSDSSVLITGESGTGKELVARALHLKSRRAAKPFEPLNCSAIPENLLESELFGHEKGAFTGAVANKPGLFEQADQGTIFFDEISEMSLPLQPKLLRVLETMEIQRVGGTSRKKVDVRILAASNKNLANAIKEGAFREDLYYRVAVLTIDVPPLRKRKEDIPLLVDYFTANFCHRRKTPVVTFHPHALEMLLEYPWPGNIRQLKNLVEKIVILSDDREILPQAIQSYINPGNRSERDPGCPGEETLEQTRKRIEKEKLILKLHSMDWDYEQTAAALEISRATLFNKMKAYGISGKRKKEV